VVKIKVLSNRRKEEVLDSAGYTATSRPGFVPPGALSFALPGLLPTCIDRINS
jgi:hypothetical protein